MNLAQLTAFADELEKIALRIRTQHGTYQKFPVLKGGIGKPNLAGDPNPRALYTAGLGGKKTEGLVHEFAARGAKVHGGAPTRAIVTVDTKKGWLPRALTAWGRKNIGTVEDVHDIIGDFDRGLLTKEEKSKVYEKLNRGVGSWWNPENPGSTLKPNKWKNFRS